MTFDKNYPNRKDWRAPYRDVKRWDRSCRVHGGCPYCESGRQHFDTKARQLAAEKLDEYAEEKEDN